MSVPPCPVLVNIIIAVETPAYGLNTPLGIDIIASSLWFSIISFLIALCWFELPKSTPSGTIDAVRPPVFNIFKNNAKNSNSVFFDLFVSANKSLAIVSNSTEPLKGGFAKTNVNLFLSSFSSPIAFLYSILGFSIPCCIKFIALILSIVWSISNP